MNQHYLKGVFSTSGRKRSRNQGRPRKRGSGERVRTFAQRKVTSKTKPMGRWPTSIGFYE